MKNNKGAISIEMIVTVIVMIILIGICIFMLTGENGLFVPKSEENVQTTNEAQQNIIDNENTTNNEDTVITVPTE